MTGCYMGCYSGGFICTVPIPCSMGNYGNFNMAGRDNYYVINGGYKIVVYNVIGFGAPIELTLDNTYGNTPMFYNGTGCSLGNSCMLYYLNNPIFGNNF